MVKQPKLGLIVTLTPGPSATTPAASMIAHHTISLHDPSLHYTQSQWQHVLHSPPPKRLPTQPTNKTTHLTPIYPLSYSTDTLWIPIPIPSVLQHPHVPSCSHSNPTLRHFANIRYYTHSLFQNKFSHNLNSPLSQNTNIHPLCSSCQHNTHFKPTLPHTFKTDTDCSCHKYTTLTTNHPLQNSEPYNLTLMLDHYPSLICLTHST